MVASEQDVSPEANAGCETRNSPFLVQENDGKRQRGQGQFYADEGVSSAVSKHGAHERVDFLCPPAGDLQAGQDRINE